jgi:hypothetical protein
MIKGFIKTKCIRLLGLLCCFALMLSSCGQTSGASGSDMAQANLLYESGDYSGAVGLYQQLIDTGIEDGAVYYNLGNAYFKSGDVGRAVLNYRRAQALLPRDPDVKANLQLAQSQTRDRLEREGNALVSFVTNLFVGWSTTDEVAVFGLIFWVALCGCGCLWLFWKKQRGLLQTMAIMLAAGLALCVLSLGLRFTDARHPHGVITATSVEVKSGPGTDYIAEFSLHSGAEIRVLEYRSGWTRIALPGDLQGWVPGDAVEQVSTRKQTS